MTFTELLKESNADADTVQQAFRLYLSEQTDDLTPEQMKRCLHKAAADQAELGRLLDELGKNSALLEQAALACLEHGWRDPSKQPAIRLALENAKVKLPVIEVGILAIAAMYGMYLVATDGGIIDDVVTTEKKGESVTTTRKIKREPFAPVAAIIGKVFGMGR
jgi:hypothetical protein